MLFGFRFLLVFVLATIIAGIYGKHFTLSVRGNFAGDPQVDLATRHKIGTLTSEIIELPEFEGT